MIPTEIDCGPLRFTITRDLAQVAHLNPTPDVNGQAFLDHGFIYIRSDLPDDQAWLTFWHEMVHVWLHVTGIKLKREERFVRSLAPTISLFFSTNEDRLHQ